MGQGAVVSTRMQGGVNLSSDDGSLTAFCAASSSICSCVEPTVKWSPCSASHASMTFCSLFHAATMPGEPAPPNPMLMVSSTIVAVWLSAEIKSASLTSS